MNVIEKYFEMRHLCEAQLIAGVYVDVMADNVNVDEPGESIDKKTQQSDEVLKIDLLLKATGDAPIMKKKKWSVDSNRNIGWIIEFIKRYFKLESSESLFLYVNQTFAPSLDQTVKNLYECFGSDGKLVLYYAKSQAWG